MADLKAAYRLFDCPDVTFERIAGPHWEQTCQQPSGRYLLLDDTTEVEFGICREISGLGPTGNGGGRGFLLHSAWPGRRFGIENPRPRRKTLPNDWHGNGSRSFGGR